MNYRKRLQNIRRLIVFFMVMLALSGITAFPLESELHYLTTHFHFSETLDGWLQRVYNTAYPFLQYGYDWLAFAHLMIALVFLGAYKHPVRNVWVIEWAMIACLSVLPLALICGPIRGIPFYWQLIDCSFGVLGIIPLYVCRRWIKQLEATSAAS